MITLTHTHHTHIRTHIHKHTQIYTHINAHTNMYTHIHSYTQTHTHTHTYQFWCSFPLDFLKYLINGEMVIISQ